MPYTEGREEGKVEDITPPPEGARIPTAEDRKRYAELEAKLKEEADRLHQLGNKAPQKDIDAWVELRKEADDLKASLERGWKEAA